MAVSRLTLCLLASCIIFSCANANESELPCDGAKVIYENVDRQGDDGREQSVIFGVPEKASDVSRCPSDVTCCSISAEEDLASMAMSSLTEKAVQLLEEKITPCSSSLLKDALAAYINSSKLELVDIMESTYGRYFRKLDIFDEFYEYLQYAVRTGDACDLGYKFNKVFFEVYLATLEAHPQVRTELYPDTPTFHLCLYNYFLEKNSASIHSYFQGLTRSLNRTLYYLRALSTAEEALRNVLNIKLTPQCALAVQRMTYCAQCAGHSSSALPCADLCLNSLRGCFVDFSDLYQPFKEFMSAVVKMKEYLEREVSPWVHIYQLQINFVDLITLTVQTGNTIHYDILVQCNPNRASPQQEAPRASRQSLYPRSTVTPPSSALNQSAYCLMDLVPLFQNLPEAVCEDMANANNQSCWNGRGMGSYDREVLSYNRTAQLDNPELIICHTPPTSLRRDILKLKIVTKELNIITRNEDCPEDDEDCSVDEQRCDYTVPSVSVSSKLKRDATDTDFDLDYSGSGSGSGSGYVYGSGSGSGCEPGEDGTTCGEVEEEEVEACLVEPIITTSVVLPSTTSSQPTITATPTTTPPPEVTTPTTPTIDSSAHSLASSLTLLLLSITFLCVL